MVLLLLGLVLCYISDHNALLIYDLKLFQNKYYNTIIVNTHNDKNEIDPLKFYIKSKKLNERPHSQI